MKTLSALSHRRATRHIDHEATLRTWLRSDASRMRALRLAAELDLEDWCLAAGFVRNLVWDKLHDKLTPSPLNDLDLIHYAPTRTCQKSDAAIQHFLEQQSPLPWSVKNQARMHIRNHDAPYTSTADAMSYWVELETAVGVRLSRDQEIELIAPFGLAPLFAGTITLNPKSGKADAFRQRVEEKAWLAHWPKLKVQQHP
ncbi:MAG: nucleotidyltransferase family protein [Pseudomonadota bacterium]|nr:nucleotidyltransferase family protein [Pseudomonadota bacterium]